MRTRETGYDDYGIGPEEVKILMARCRESEETRRLLHDACNQACDSLAMFLEFSILAGVPYDQLMKVVYIPIGIDSFYGYRRKALAIFKALDIEIN